MKRTYIILLAIFAIALLLRIYRLSEVPAGFHRDEAFLGYNSYSLLKTGRDMSGVFLPLHFESFIYSPGGYSYLTIPSITLFGLSVFSTRFTAAFFGSVTVLVAFLLVRELFPSSKNRLALLTSFLLSITPWHINLSRASAESVIVVFFLTLGTLLYLYSFKSKRLLFHILAYISFSITLTIYQAPRIFLPLFIPFLYLIFFNTSKKKQLFNGVFLYIILIIFPVIAILTSPTLSTRLKTVGIWSTSETRLIVDEQIREDGVMHIPVALSRLSHNKAIGYTEAFLKNYFQHFSYSFLFTDQGLPERYRVPNSGLLFITFLPLILLGLYNSVRIYPKQSIILYSWILISIIGSALTFDDVPNLQRTVLIFPALSIIIALGIEFILQINNKTIIRLLLTLIFLTVSLEGYRYLHHYYIQQLVHRPWKRQEGYQELVNLVEERKKYYDKVIITNRESAPTIFFLFFTKYNPDKFQKETKNSKLRDFDRINFGTYQFSEEECPLKEVVYTDIKTNIPVTNCYADKNTLYVNSGLCNKPQVCANVLNTIKRNDGTPVFLLLEASPQDATNSGQNK